SSAMMVRSCRRYSARFSTNSVPPTASAGDSRDKRISGAQLAKSRPQRSDTLRSQALTNLFLSSPPSWKAFADQRLALVRYFDQMASAIPAPLEPEPSPRAHPSTLRLSVDSSI